MADQKTKKFLVCTRKVDRTNVTKTCNQVSMEIDQYSAADCKSKLRKLEELKLKLEKANASILELLWDESGSEDHDESVADEMNACEIYEDKIYETISLLETRISDLQNSTQPGANSTLHSATPNLTHHNIKLPQLPLPEFSHSKGENLSNFFENF